MSTDPAEPVPAVNVGCLGITHPHASARIRALRAIDGVTVGCAADSAPGLARFCEIYDLKPVDEETILADEAVNAVIVHSKSDQMVRLALAALRAGKAVLVEKPGGANVNDIEALAVEVASRGGIVQVGYNCRLAQSVSTAQRWLAEGVIGEVVTVNAHGAAQVGEHLSAHLNQPADMGGGLWVIGCHVLDIILALCGMPETVAARVSKFAPISDERSREDAAAVILQYPNLLGVYDFSVHEPLEWFESSRVTLSGTEGLMEIGLLPQTLRVHRATPSGSIPAGWSSWRDTQFETPWTKNEENDFSELSELANLTFFHTEARDFVRSIREGELPSVSVQDALNVARLVQACFDSEAAGGAPVALQHGGPGR